MALDLNRSELSSTAYIASVDLIDQGMINHSSQKTVEDILTKTILPFIILFGSVGNIAAFRTLWNQKPRDSITLYLLALCMSDSFVLAVFIISWLKTLLRTYDKFAADQLTARTFLPLFMVFGVASQRITAVITAFLTIERLLAVKFPFLVKTLFFSTHPRKIIFGTFVFCILFMVPNVFRFNVSVNLDPSTNTTFVSIKKTEFARSTNFYKYYGLLAHVLMSILPMTVVLFANLTTILILRVRKARKQSMTCLKHNRKRDEQKITTLLLVISFIFLLCTTPSTITLIVTKFDDDFGQMRKEHYLFEVILSVSSLLICLNSSVNFVVYMALSSRFRKSFKKVWGCKGQQTDVQNTKALPQGSRDSVKVTAISAG